MDAKFQPSFIPKQPMASVSRGVSGHVSLLYVIASIIFIVTLGLMGAAFIAERTIRSDIANLNAQIIAAQASFELSTIEDLRRVSAMTTIAHGLLEKHIALSKFLESLGDVTYSNVSFSGLTLDTANGTDVTASLQGMAGSYNALILQSDLFENLSFLKTPAFSDFGLDKSGSVSFSFTATIDPPLIDYKRYITGE